MGGEDSSAGKSSDVYKCEYLSSHMCMYAHRYMERTHNPPLLPDFFDKVSVQNEMFPLNSFSSVAHHGVWAYGMCLTVFVFSLNVIK